MMSEQQYYYLWNDYNLIITKMQVKTIEFKERNPSIDISEQLATIETLIHLQNIFSRQYDLIITLGNQHGRWNEEKNRLLYRISELEKENKNLKESINI